MLNAEADLGSEDEDEADIRPVKRLRAGSPSPQLDVDEEMMAGIVAAADGEDAVSVDGGDNDANNYGLSDGGGNEEMGDDCDIGGNIFGGGMNNGVISSSFIISNDV
jgi:hypothetical protein